MKVKDILSGVAEYFFPNKCMSCGKITGHKELCDSCLGNMQIIDGEKRCYYCGMEKPDCDCKEHIYYFESAASVFFNEGSGKNIIYRYKLGSKSFYSKYIANRMTDLVKEAYPDMVFDVVVPVPTSFRSSDKKGFDHTYLLAKKISKNIGVRADRSILRVRAYKKPQHLSGYKERFKNASDNYYFKKKVDFGNVLLVDDIKTTGATLNACSRELLLAGAKRIYCITALGGARKKRL